MRRTRIVPVLAVVFSIAAGAVCYKLLNKHITGSSGSGWFDAGCTDGAAPGSANCAAVLASRYSYFPAKPAEGTGYLPRLPVAFLGLIYYSVLAVWLIGVGRPSPQRRWLHAVPLIVVGFGLAMSAYYLMIMFRVLDQWCSWCLVTHVLNFLIALCLVLMWPGRGRGTTADVDPLASPSTRMIVVTVLAIAASAYGELNMLGLKTWKRQAQQLEDGYKSCVAAVNRIKEDPETLLRHWRSGTKHDIVVRPDDPIRANPVPDGKPPLEIIVFSDFECPSCAKFAAFFEESAGPLFAGRWKLVFKHYPIDRSCNDRAAQTMHAHACHAASLAEAARRLGGNDLFWRAHDYLFRHRDALAQGKISADAFALGLGLDPKAFGGAADSEAFRIRVTEDVQQARNCDVKGTPAVFVEGRQVDILAAMEVGFWDKLADTYWQRIQVPRPETARPPPAATPNNPNRKDAP